MKTHLLLVLLLPACWSLAVAQDDFGDFKGFNFVQSLEGDDADGGLANDTTNGTSTDLGDVPVDVPVGGDSNLMMGDQPQSERDVDPTRAPGGPTPPPAVVRENTTSTAAPSSTEESKGGAPPQIASVVVVLGAFVLRFLY